MKRIVVVTGGFDPLHSGHIECFRQAKTLGDTLLVGVNSDEWLTRKKGQPFMSLQERMTLVTSIKDVDIAMSFDDSDDSAVKLLEDLKQRYPEDKIVFANGGDRNAGNIPELIVKDVQFVFGIGGNFKMNSSSWLLQEWKAPKVERQWGYYRVLHELPGTKVKELTVEPGKSLSMQRHEHRSEYWFVAEGACQVKTETSDMLVYAHDEMIKIPVGSWHQLNNPFDKPCRIVEIQYGTECIEIDIERKE